MTERLLSITTQLATPIQTTLNSAAPISASDAIPVVESADEEPYTIKCICEYSDDDGNTIYCETCDTWQHIECFYPGRVADASRDEFDHSCQDCVPRPLELDRETATERQRSRRQEKADNDNSDKKSKRPPSKSHKKKTKPSEVQINGFHAFDGYKNGSPQEQHQQTKKSKGHRPSQSVGGSVTKRSPPFTARPANHGHPPSPAHTPPDLPQNFQVHGYSENFLSLFDHDVPKDAVTTNSFASLAVTNAMSLWLSDPARLQEDAGVTDKRDVFQYLKVISVDALQWPELVVEEKDETINGTHLHWRQLHTKDSIPDNGRMAELNGIVGFQKDYCNELASRWSDFVHPRPFVFFHPRLPLFIDTRHEGSSCRIVRRSCKANTNIETFIANGAEYHFWLTSERPLAAGEQITIPWDFRFPAHCKARFLHLLNLGDEDGTPFDGAEITDEEYDQLTSTIHLVLSDYGGCACDLGADCAFARFHRNYHGRSHAQPNGVKPKKGRKPKNSHVSPTSTGHATNSRAASEGQQEQFDEDDVRSVSGSIRSKPRSRDLTPSHAENNGILTEPSDREKRKLAMLEDSFRKMEQGQPPRKKKRASDGVNTNTSGHSIPSHPTPKQRKGSIVPRASHHSTSHTNGGKGRNYADASTSQRQSGSPSSAFSPKAAALSPNNVSSRNGSIVYSSRQPSVPVKSVYVDQAVQTDDVEDAWWKESPKPNAKRCIVPLARRLLKNRHRIQQQQELVEAQQAVNSKELADVKMQTSPEVLMDLDVPTHDAESPTTTKDRNASVSSSTPSLDAISTIGDTNMTEPPAIAVGITIKPPPPPWPTATINLPKPPRSPELHVQMPPTPIFSTPNMSGTLSASATPSSATASTVQSPFGTVHFPPFTPTSGNSIAPSPIKTTKKLSLSDYKASRLKKADTTGSSKSSSGSGAPGAPAVLKPSLSTIEEAKAQGGLEGSAIVDPPILEKITSSPLSNGGSTTDAASKGDL